MPPSIVLEVLRILEAEVNLRDETRVAEQSRTAVTVETHEETANRLTGTQRRIAERIRAVTERILQLPDAQSSFANDLKLLNSVAVVMDEATEILSQHNTGNAAIGAETEAIELLLQSKRINPQGGGGSGGANPGGGGSGTTADSAIALLGSSTNTKNPQQETATEQVVGTEQRQLPAEFQHGIDEFFHRVEQP